MNIALKCLNLIAFLLLVFVNFLTPAGRKISEVSGSIDYLFRPANYAFSIWGLIYTLLFIWVLYAFFANITMLKAYKRVTPYFLLNVFFNVLWIQLFGNGKIGASVIAMFGVLLTLIYIYSTMVDNPNLGFLFRVPFSLYLGWISVATIVNMFVFIKHIGIESLFGISEYSWTIIVLVVGGIIALLFMKKNDDVLFPLVFIWAYVAIIVSQYNERGIVYTAAVVSIILFISIIMHIFKKLK